jgi:hypothetical protein
MFYPADDLPDDKQKLLNQLDEEESSFTQTVLQHRVAAMKGKMFSEIFPIQDRQPAQLQQLFNLWKENPTLIEKSPPTLVFAAMGQAKFDMAINADEENSLLTQQLRNWAYRRK